MPLSSTLDPDIVAFGRTIGFVLFLGVLPVALITFFIIGIKLIFRRSTKRIILLLVSGFVSATLLLPLVAVIRGVLSSRSFGGMDQGPASKGAQLSGSDEHAARTQSPSHIPQGDMWGEVTGIRIFHGGRDMSATDIYNHFSPTVVTVLTESEAHLHTDKTKGMQGTGVLLKSPSGVANSTFWVLTCYHIMDGMKGEFVIIDHKGREISVSADVAVVDAGNDWCLVPLTSVANIEIGDLPALSMTDILPEIGEDVFAIGTPEGMELTLSKGIVSSIRRQEQGDKIQTTCPISSGSSGSPCFNAKGSFIGIFVESLKEGQNINFMVSAQTMRNNLNSDKVKVVRFESNDQPNKPYTISSDMWTLVEEDDFLNKKRFQRKQLNGRKFPQQLHLYNEPMDTSNEYYKKYSQLYPGVFVKSERLSADHITLTMDMFAGNEHLVSIETWPLPSDRKSLDRWISGRFHQTLDDLKYDYTSSK